MAEKPTPKEVLNQLLDAQFADIEKACGAGADMLCLVGCMNLIEFMGGAKNGSIGGRGTSKSHFEAGVSLLDAKLSEVRNLGVSGLWSLRCALTHQYVPEAERVGIFTIWGKSIRHITSDKEMKVFRAEPGNIRPLAISIHPARFIKGLKSARERLLEWLDRHPKSMNKLAINLFWLPKVGEWNAENNWGMGPSWLNQAQNNKED